MAGAEACRYLEWDSEFFQRRIAAVVPRRLEATALPGMLRWCETRGVECLYFLCQAADLDSVRVAESAGFKLVDVRMTFELRRDGPVGPLTGQTGPFVRQACPDDIPVLRRIAALSHHDSRFYADGHFPEQRCDALYQTWVENSCRGWADVVWMAEHEGRAAGYLTCHLDPPTAGRIGLFGVRADAQGRGLGLKLLDAALGWFDGRAASLVTVVTQARNIRAQRFYQKAGFLIRQVDLWYHHWFAPYSEP